MSIVIRYIIIFAAKTDNGRLLEKLKWQEVEVEEEEVAVVEGRHPPEYVCSSSTHNFRSGHAG